MMSTNRAIRETIIREVSVASDGIEYKYTLLMKESAKVASYGLPLYSISVEMTDTDGNTSYARIGDAFANQNKAATFFKRLYENLATPINLPYIFEDEFML